MVRKTKDLGGVTLIIPVLNEEKTLSKIIQRCLQQKIVSQLIVVNDGSTDKTGKILASLKQGNTSRNPRLTIIHHPKNMGKGTAIKTGIKKALGKYIMVQDADLEYSPEEIINLYKAAEKSKDGIVFGNRTTNKKKGYLLAQLGNWYLNKMFNLMFSFKLMDSYTCYKLMRKKIWLELGLKSNGFEIDSELVAKLGVKKYQIIEVPISYNPRKYAQGKKIKWLDLIKATIVALNVRLVRPKLS